MTAALPVRIVQIFGDGDDESTARNVAGMFSTRSRLMRSRNGTHCAHGIVPGEHNILGISDLV